MRSSSMFSSRLSFRRFPRTAVAGVAVALFLSPSLLAGPLPVMFLDNVVAIGRKEARSGSTQMRWIGEASGFFYGELDHKIDDGHNSYNLYLVTNRHVIEDHIHATSQPLSIRLNPKSGGAAREFDFPLEADGQPTWHAHPDPLVDLAVVRVSANGLQSLDLRFDYFHSDRDCLSRARARDLGLSEGYGVFVLGFPMGVLPLGEHAPDYVVARQGSIARIRDSLDSPDTAKTFLIDALIFPGNSGSPVVLRPETTLSQFPGEKPPIKTAYLLGVVRGYQAYMDAAVSPQTGRTRVTFEENSGLAEVIPGDYIDETIQDAKKSKASHPTETK